MGKIKQNVRKLVVAFIECYRYLISPIIGPCCRFYPSCSAYSKQAVMRFGLFKGGILSILRLLKCNPWHSGGHDPVPTNKEVDDNK